MNLNNQHFGYVCPLMCRASWEITTHINSLYDINPKGEVPCPYECGSMKKPQDPAPPKQTFQKCWIFPKKTQTHPYLPSPLLRTHRFVLRVESRTLSTTELLSIPETSFSVKLKKKKILQKPCTCSGFGVNVGSGPQGPHIKRTHHCLSLSLTPSI